MHKIDDCSPLCLVTAKSVCGVANVIVVIVHFVDSGHLSDHHQLHYQSQVTKKCSNIRDCQYMMTRAPWSAKLGHKVWLYL